MADMNALIRAAAGQQPPPADEADASPPTPPDDGGAREFSAPRRPPSMNTLLRAAHQAAMAQPRQSGVVFTRAPAKLNVRRPQEEGKSDG